MKHGKKALLGLTAGLALAGVSLSALALSAENPYHAVADRNVFGLKPPAPPPADPSSIKPPPPKITLTGITTIFGRRRALMKMTPIGAKGAVPPPKEQSYILEEGQKDGDLEVLTIDENAGSVSVNAYGSITNLTFEVNGPPKVAGGSSAPPPPSGLPVPYSPGFSPPGGGLRSIPTRTLRLPGNTATPAGGGAQPTAGSGESGSPAPEMGMGGGPGYPQPAQPTQPEISPEATAIATEAAYQQAVKKNDPSAGLFPPSVFDPKRNLTPGPESGGPETGNTQASPGPPIPGRSRFQRPF